MKHGDLFYFSYADNSSFQPTTENFNPFSLRLPALGLAHVRVALRGW